MKAASGCLGKADADPALFALGPDGVLVRFATGLDDASNRAALAAAARIEARPPTGMIEVATSLVSVLVRFDPGATTHHDVADHLRALLTEEDWRTATLPRGRTLWHIPVAFGGEHGPQLAAVAQDAGVSEPRAVEDITAAPLRVLALGFAPGQPYIGFLPDRYDLPRQNDLTAQVPASSLVLAVRQLVLFANAAPTGWCLVGQTRFPCFRPDAATPVALSAGDEVRFHAVGHGEFAALADTPMGGARQERLP